MGDSVEHPAGLPVFRQLARQSDPVDMRRVGAIPGQVEQLAALHRESSHQGVAEHESLEEGHFVLTDDDARTVDPRKPVRGRPGGSYMTTVAA